MEVELFLLVLSFLFFASIMTDKVSTRFGVPALLLFLGVGMLFGSEGLGLSFDNIGLAQAIGTIALCVILFSGGMDTKIAEVKPVIGPGLTLATLGVLLTAGITGVLSYLILGWTHATVGVSLLTCLLLASTMSSTDSASVFSLLRTNGVRLKHNLRPMLELESGSNDPMAYVLTTTLIGALTAGTTPNVWMMILTIVVQLIIGALAGFLFGKLMLWIMRKVAITNESLYPIFVLTICIFIFSATYFLQGNSYLAVYIGGLMIGNTKFAHKRSTMSFFDGLSWLCQLAMFLTLGLLVNPHELIGVIVPGLIVSVVMIFISRPLSVFLSMIPFKNYDFRDKCFVSWVGLRGAVPIIFAILCLANGVEHANLIFNIVFFCTLVSLILQGSTLTTMARWLKVEDNAEDNGIKNFDILLPEDCKSVASELVVTEEMLSHGCRLMDLQIPSNTLVIMVKRDGNFFVPKGQNEIKVGDNLLLITDNKETLKQTEESMLDKNWIPQLFEHTRDFIFHHFPVLKQKREVFVAQKKEEWEQLKNKHKRRHKKIQKEEQSNNEVDKQ